MKAVKKQTFLSAFAAAALVITPIVVFAAVYSSLPRNNEFRQGNVDITIRENNIAETMHSTELTLNDQYVVSKKIEIKDKRSGSDEALRVCFVPIWLDKDDATMICGNACDLGTPVMNTNGKLSYPGGMTLTLAGTWTKDENTNVWTSNNGWIYRTGEDRFYYSGALETGSLTPTLLESVELSGKALAAASSYTFRLDVLADAIQTSGSALTDRHWNS